MKVVIMAGGAGTRFWPLSTEKKPKQFLKLTSDKTMIQETYERFRSWLAPSDIHVVTTETFKPLILDQLPELWEEQVIIEPCRRDTGPCLALTALHFLERGEDEVLVTAPSDQYIPDAGGLRQVLELAEKAAREDGVISTLGIVPNRPETGYGYIETEAGPDAAGIYKVSSFLEKPSREKAEELIRNPSIFWNSGIFIWKPSTIAGYMKLFQPALWGLLSDKRGRLAEIYPQLPKISVDYAILEKADRVTMVPFPYEWDDVGTWTSLERVHAADECGNLMVGDGIHTLDVSGTTIWTGKRKAVAVGVKDLVIVLTEEGLLVCHKSQEQLIKKIIQSL